MRRKHEEELAKYEAEGRITEEAEEDEDGDMGEDERKAKKMTKINQDLIRETGGPMSLTGGPSYDFGLRGPPSKIQMLMAFNHLNTIEEEKHETQNSNYFRDGESERDISGSHIFAKGSRILDDLDASGSGKPSPEQRIKPKAVLEEPEDYQESHDEEDADKHDEEEDNEEYEMDEDDEQAVEADGDKVEEEVQPRIETVPQEKSI